MMLMDEIWASRRAILAKAASNGLKDFSEIEMHRVFAETASPVGCMRSMSKMIAMGLRIEDVYSGRVPMDDVLVYFRGRSNGETRRLDNAEMA